MQGSKKRFFNIFSFSKKPNFKRHFFQESRNFVGFFYFRFFLRLVYCRNASTTSHLVWSDFWIFFLFLSYRSVGGGSNPAGDIFPHFFEKKHKGFYVEKKSKKRKKMRLFSTFFKVKTHTLFSQKSKKNITSWGSNRRRPVDQTKKKIGPYQVWSCWRISSVNKA